MKATFSWIRTTNLWQSPRRAGLVVLGVCLLWNGVAGADDFYWTNRTVNGVFSNPNNWFTNGVPAGAVPGSADNANFTNNANYTVNWTTDAANANAIFDTTGTLITTLSNAMWSLNNSFVVGQNDGKTGSVTLASGSLAVTNASGTAAMIIGQAGKGTFTLGGGTVTLDQLYVTNNVGGSFTNSILVLNSGTLNTPNGSVISALGNFGVGNNGTLTWNITGGTNVLVTTGLINLGGGASGRALVTVSGLGTLWTNDAVPNVSGAFLIGGAGSGNELVISDQAHVISPDSTLGTTSISSNRVTVTGTNSIWNTAVLVVGYRANVQNKLFITNGGLVRSTSGFIGRVEQFATSNSVLVADPGSSWLMSGDLIVGSGGWSNAMVISSGGLVSNVNGTIGYSTANNNSVLVTGTNSSWLMSGSLTVGRQGIECLLTVEDGALVSSTNGASIGATSLGASNSVLVTDPGSRWVMNNTLFVGNNSSGNSLTILNGGSVSNTGALIGNAASSGSANNNSVLVSNAGSRWIIGGTLTVGSAPVASESNSMTIADGGFVANSNANIGSSVASTGSTVLVTGPGTMWQNIGTVSVGSNATTRGFGAGVLVQDGATLEARGLVSGFLVGGTPSGVISNNGGIYQFTTNAPVITTNTANSIVLNNGKISFRGITNANVFGNSIGTGSNQLVKITFQGDNAFRLNGSSNAIGVSAYTFATGTPTNYAALELVNDSTLWRSTALTIGGTGRLLVSNTTATIAAPLTSIGSVDVVNSKLTLASNVVISGGFRSDPSTNTFNANATITSSGYLSGSNGDLFVFERNLINQSASNTLFDLQFASVLFTNGVGTHILESPGSDNGDGYVGIGSVTDNFAFGWLTLSGVDSLRVTGTVGSALYVGGLDFGGLGNTNNLFLDINLYYDSTLAANSYLAGQSYDLQGAGFLLPNPGVVVVPEPSVLGLLLMASLGLVWRRRNNNPTQT